MANTLPAKVGGKALTKFEKEMLAAAREEATREKAPSGNYISTTGGEFSFQGVKMPNPFSAVVVDYSFVNTLYEGTYDENNIQPPICFAASMVEADLAPSPNSPEPQAKKCSECPNNEFGSADNGSGKRCKNTRRVALLPYDPKVKLDTAEPAFIKLSPTALRAWAGYVNGLSKATNRVPSAVVTQFEAVRKGGSFYVSPALSEVLSEKEYRMVQKRRDSVRDALLAEPDFSARAQAPKKGKGKPAARIKKKR